MTEALLYNRAYLQNAAKNYISKHFTVKDVCYSDTALKRSLNNIPTIPVINNSKLLAENILEAIVIFYSKNLNVHCMYRSDIVNKAVGGVVDKKTGKSTSQHCFGQACDFTINGIDTKKIFNDIISGRIKNSKGKPLKDILDQCIFENNGAWIHISFDKAKSRKQFMTALNGVYKSVYKEI